MIRAIRCCSGPLQPSPSQIFDGAFGSGGVNGLSAKSIAVSM